MLHARNPPGAAERVQRRQRAAAASREPGLGPSQVYFKTQECERLDDEYGDIASAIKDQEAKLIRDLESEMLHELPALKRAQHALAELDCLLALAASARDLGLTRPEITDDGATRIKQGWHPLLRQRVPQLVPNDCELGGSGSPGRLMLLTGPNASGKTVYLRTVALITYLAHVGSFVPAEAAVIARADAIHTRMHSRESAAVNASAFMLDLSQMAAMLRHATPRSLCLIDEFGKGTNAQDGISLLYACLQHFLERGDACPKTLACTHYTELLEVPGFRSSRNLVLWTMEVMLQPKEEADDTLDEVVFLHRARPGEFGDSFGWHCAASADLPPSVIERARAISHARAGGLPVFAIDSDVEGWVELPRRAPAARAPAHSPAWRCAGFGDATRPSSRSSTRSSTTTSASARQTASTSRRRRRWPRSRCARQRKRPARRLQEIRIGSPP